MVADALRQGVDEPGAQGNADDGPFDLALLAVVRARRGAGACRCRSRTRACVRGVAADGGAAGGSPWQQRLLARRAATTGSSRRWRSVRSHAGSRHTASGRGWTPNAVTARQPASSAWPPVLAAVDSLWWAWLLAAVLLQASLVARLRRRGDRAVHPALQPARWMARRRQRPRQGVHDRRGARLGGGRGAASDLWWLAVARPRGPRGASRRGLRLHGAASARRPRTAEHLTGGVGRRGAGCDCRGWACGAGAHRAAARDAHGVLRAPSRCCTCPSPSATSIMSLGLLTLRPAVVLWALGIASVIALAWTQTGRLLRASDRTRRLRPRPAATDSCADLCDLALLPRPSGPRPAGLAAAGAAARARDGRPAARRRARRAVARAAAYAWLAAVCWHVYDNVYRLRETGQRVRTVAAAGRLGSRCASSCSRSSAARPADPRRALLVGAAVLAVLYARRVGRRLARATSQHAGADTAADARQEDDCDARPDRRPPDHRAAASGGPATRAHRALQRRALGGRALHPAPVDLRHPGAAADAHHTQRRHLADDPRRRGRRLRHPLRWRRRPRRRGRSRCSCRSCSTAPTARSRGGASGSRRPASTSTASATTSPRPPSPWPSGCAPTTWSLLPAG